MARQAGTVRIKNLNETLRALNKCQRGLHKSMMGGLLEAAEPVTTSWQGKVGKYAGASTSTIGPRMTTKSVFVTQKARKRTGKRGDFGSLQMRHGLAALFEEADNTEKEVEKALDKLTEGEGF